jgi:hypothetical protein
MQYLSAALHFNFDMVLLAAARDPLDSEPGETVREFAACRH